MWSDQVWADVADDDADVQQRTESNLNADPLAAARAFLKRGWKPVPVAYRQKRPIGDGWQNREITPVNVAEYFEGEPMNIGVQLGRASGGLTDVDLDCDEAILLAQDLLPPTDAVFGRHSKASSHWLYVTDLCETEQKAAIRYTEPKALARDPDKPAVLVELRIGAGDKGAHTMAPGSVHPSGERVGWEHEGEPAEVSGSDLQRRVGALAAAALLVRHYPAEGSRHDAALVLGGVLARIPGMDAKDIKRFVSAVADAAKDEESDERGCSAAGAVDLLKRGQPTPGLPRMREVWGKEVTDTVAGWLNVDPLAGCIVLSAGAPWIWAEEYVKRCRSAAYVPLLRAYRGAFYAWTGTHYRELSDEAVESELYRFLNEAVTIDKGGDIGPFNPTKHKVTEAVHALRRKMLVDRDCETPAWLDQQKGRYADHLLACRNGILNIKTRQLLPHDPLFFTMNCLPLEYDPSAPQPKRWLDFLTELWPEDEEAKDCLQEIFGYLLTADTRQHKLFLLVGPKRGGKGTIVFVLGELLGKDNIVFPTLKTMAGEFGRWPLIDKKLAVIADARLGPKADAHAVAEQLLSISGGDPQTINRKNQSFWSGKLGVRFLITSNELPAITDASGTLPSRFVLLKLTQSFYGREDLELKEKLRAELPGILIWALDGLERLRKRGHFDIPVSSAESLRTLEDLASPITAFLRDWCEVDPRNRVNVKSLYRAYRAWAEESGHRPVPRHVFGKSLHAILPTLHITGVGAKRTYTGVALSSHGRDEYAQAIAPH
jgi:putative DNA primase/helicase